MSFAPITKRCIATLLLLLMLHSTLAPTAFALTSQYQPEYTHYESSGSTDMVNLATGDFQYSLPLLNVPGPNGGFSLPLSYTGGIQLDQEASWVGLGWSMNAGSIMRQVSQYADDVNDRRAYTNAYDPGEHGYSINFLGVYKENYSSEKGKGGSIGIGNIIRAGFGNEAGNAALLGLSNTASMTENLIGLASLAAIVVTAGISVAASAEASITCTATTTIGKEIGKGLVILTITDAASSALFEGIGMSMQSAGRTTNINDWTVSTRKGNIFGKPSTWKYSLDVRNREERMYGALYMGDMPVTTGGMASTNPLYFPEFRIWEGSHTGSGVSAERYNSTESSMVASDTHFDLAGYNYVEHTAPTSIAYDSYSVMAGSVSGSITPYRTEMGSTAFPQVNKGFDIGDIGSLALNGMLPSYVSYAAKRFSMAKVPFRYEGEFASYYTYHSGHAAAYGAGDQLGASIQASEGDYTSFGDSGDDAQFLNWRNDQGFVLEDDILYDREEYVENDRDNPAQDNAGSYMNGRVVQGKHIEWYTNDDIKAALDDMAGNAALPNPLRLIPYYDPDEVGGYSFDDLPDEGIGGMAITSADGTTYHFALPVMSRGWWQRSGRIGFETPPITYHSVTTGFYTQIVPVAGAFSETISGEPHAVNWLLTAITGPDYVDRGVLGRIDAEDWGNWVKMDYGSLTHYYHYRAPYLHNNVYMYSANPESSHRDNFMRGTRDAYYLDRIETPSHVALFVKNVRKDGKGDYNHAKITDSTSDPAYREGFATSGYDYPSCALKLDEILLLKKSDLDEVLDDGAYLESRGGSASDSLICDSESPWNVLDVHDIAGTLRTSLINRQVLRIKFNYDHSLCQGTYNSFDMEHGGEPPRWPTIGDGGKLTLRSLEIHGRKDVKLAADNLFEYEGDNPRYHPQLWDGWGMYTARGGLFSDTTSYRSQDNSPTVERQGSHEATDAGTGWELTKITTPSGAVIEVEQERDTYSSVAGQPTYMELRSSGDEVLDAGDGDARVRTNIDLEAYPFLRDGAPVYLATTRVNVVDAGLTLEILGPNEIRIHGLEAPLSLTNIADHKIYVQVPEKFGGDLRVLSVQVTDPFSGTVSKNVYRYTTNGEKSGTSSGVCSVEPEFCRALDKPYFRDYDYPLTPVIYGKVTLLSDGEHSGQYSGKRVYSFRTPDAKMSSARATSTVEAIANTATVDLEGGLTPVSFAIRTQALNFCTDVATSGIGMLESEEQYDSRAFLHKKTSYAYDEPGREHPGRYGDLGIFTEGSLQTEAMASMDHSELWLRLIRSTKRHLPTIPVSVTVTEDGLSKTITNTAYDNITGAVTGTEYRDAWNSLFRTRSVAAYRKYPGMGPVGLDPTNVNIVSAVGEEYLYTVQDEEEHVLNANVTTFKKGWAHRYFNGSTFTTSSEDDVWRSDGTYAWKGKLQGDGSYKDFVDFDWEENATQNSGWNKLSTATRYDIVSRAVEAMDINGQYAGTRYSQNDQVLGSAALARLSEIYMSGAEERIGSTDWFDGEVKGASGVSTTYSHTGKYSVRADDGQQGFNLTTAIGTGDDQVRRQAYRASVWVNKHNLQRGDLYYKTYNVSNTLIASGSISASAIAPKFRAGDWYLLELQVPEAVMTNVAATKLEVGARNTTATSTAGDNYAYFDDFRLHPFHSALSTNVYDPATGQLTAALDANNLATRYTYDTRGRLIRTEVETKDGFVRVKEYAYTEARE